MSQDWQPTEDRREGWVVYINPRTREVAVEVDGNRLVALESFQRPTEPYLPEKAPTWSLSPERARQIAAECPLRWQDVRRIAEEHSQMGYAGWLERAPADEVAEFVWSCWLDAHTEEGG